MATNKHALIRYQALDKCFSNFGRQFFIDDLIEACNDALYQYTGDEKYSDPIAPGISRRQIFDDIAFMESDAGYQIPLEKHKGGSSGRKVYYRYSDKDFSINNQPITDEEMKQLREMTSLLNRFKGLPQCEWMEELVTNLEDKFKIKGTSKSVISMESNAYVEGLKYLSQLFNAIINRQVLHIVYSPFNKSDFEWDIHPYFIKQYNNRWFLVGLETELLPRIPMSVLPLDRIDDFKVLPDLVYQEHCGIDFDDYFYDIVGVSLNPESRPVKIIARAGYPAAYYIETKPIHPSQRILERGDEYLIFQWNLIVNYELETQLLTYADQCEIIEPIELREKLRDRAIKIIELNS